MSICFVVETRSHAICFVDFLEGCDFVKVTSNTEKVMFKLSESYIRQRVTSELSRKLYPEKLHPKKKSSKHINMGSSFEDLVATRPTVKTESNFNKNSEL